MPRECAAHFSEKTGTTVTNEDVIQGANNLRRYIKAAIKVRVKDGDPEEIARLDKLLGQMLPRKHRKSANAMDAAVDEFFAKAKESAVPNTEATAEPQED